MHRFRLEASLQVESCLLVLSRWRIAGECPWDFVRILIEEMKRVSTLQGRSGHESRVFTSLFYFFFPLAERATYLYFNSTLQSYFFLSFFVNRSFVIIHNRIEKEK